MLETEEYFHESFKNMKRLGPGSTVSTLKAISFYPNQKLPIKVLDIGCGIGTHTFLLAEQFPNAEIVAIDNNPHYIEHLNEVAEKSGLSDRVQGIVISMSAMTWHEGSFDLIWGEGSIYIIGFRQGLKEWQPFLKPGGYIICSEISWLKSNPSEESYQFWKENYPEIDSIDVKRKQIESAGYLLQGHFICPITDWTINYYEPMQKNLDAMRKKYVGNETALRVVDILQLEIDIYTRHNDDFSYVFYAMKRI